MTSTHQQSLQTFSLPDVGEGLTEAEILGWRVAVGDVVVINQVLVEIETAKAAVELPSPFAGRVQAILVAAGVTVDVGAPIITIATGARAPSAATEVAPQTPAGDDDPGTKIGEMTADGKIATLVGYVSTNVSTARRPRKADPVATAAAPLPLPAPAIAPVTVPLATPPVRKLAKDLGVDLASVVPTGVNGVVTRADVQQAVARGSSDAAPATGVVEAAPTPAYDPATRQRRVTIKGVRKATAAAMVASAFTAPHVTEFLTVDVTELMRLRDLLRERREFAGVKLTPLVFAARAAVVAIARTPDVNAFWDEAAQQIVYQDYVHLGIAAATPRGLIVPKIRDADSLDLRGLADALTELTEVARLGRTPPSAMTGGTFTITNVGVFGIDTGTPIINPGESGILALGSIKDAPWVVDGQLAVRKVCQLALSFDHRVVDGQQGSIFLADVGALLAEPGLALAW